MWLFLRIIIRTRIVFALGLSSLNYGAESSLDKIHRKKKKEAALTRAHLIARIFLYLISRSSLSTTRYESGDRNRLTCPIRRGNVTRWRQRDWVNESASGNVIPTEKKSPVIKVIELARITRLSLGCYFFRCQLIQNSTRYTNRKFISRTGH